LSVSTIAETLWGLWCVQICGTYTNFDKINLQTKKSLCKNSVSCV
jgi:hypothetical protein